MSTISFLFYVFSEVTKASLPSGEHSGQPWNYNTVFVFTVATHFVMDINTLPLDLVLHSAYRHSRIRLLPLNRFFMRGLQRIDSVSSAHQLCHSSRINVCMLPQIICFGKTCLTFGTRVVVRHFVKICYQESVLFLYADVHSGHPNVSCISTKRYLRRQPHCSR